MEVLTRSENHYYPDGDFVLQVQTTLYRVYQHTLKQHSELFRALLSLPHHSQEEGRNDDTPAVMPNILAEDVNLLFDVLWANHQDADLWGVVKLGRLLKISHFFGCPAGVNFGLSKLTILPRSNGVERLFTALANEVPIDRCEPFIRTLVQEPVHTLPPQHLSLLSPVIWERLLYHREEIRKLRYAAAVPGEYSPSPTCTHRDICNKMWAMLWKKHMAHILLDANRPLDDIMTTIEKIANLRDCECLVFCVANQTHLINEARAIKVAVDDLKALLIPENRP